MLLLAGFPQVQPMGSMDRREGGKRENVGYTFPLSACFGGTVLACHYDGPCWASLPPCCQPSLESGENTIPLSTPLSLAVVMASQCAPPWVPPVPLLGARLRLADSAFQN